MEGRRGAEYTKLANKALWEQAHTMFTAFDEDGSGYLDKAEVQHGLERFGQQRSDDELQKLFDEIGAGKEGLSKLQFMSLFAKVMGFRTLKPPSMSGRRGAVFTQVANKALWEQAHTMFTIFDEDGSGYLDKAEVQHGLERFGQQRSDDELQKLFDEIGAGKEGLSKLQFMSLFAKVMGLHEKPKFDAGFRTEVYEKYAQYSESAIREAAATESSAGVVRKLLECRAADLPAIRPNEYKSVPEGYTH